MKKYISLMAIAIVAIFSSCSNDDITIGAPSVVNINASSVISSFVEYNEGELEVASSGYSIRIRGLVYNTRGELVADETGYFSNYNQSLSLKSYLSPGTYTVIGISDVVAKSGSSVETEFWTVSGEAKLAEMQIVDQKKVGYEARVLGLAKGTLTVQGSQSNSLTLDLKPAGSLIYAFVMNREAFSGRDISSYNVYANKTSDAIKFDANGNYTITERQEDGIIYKLFGFESGTGGVYGLNYILPMKNVEVWFTANEDGENKTFPTDNRATLNISAGEEYEFDLYLDTNIYNIETAYSQVDLSSASSRYFEWAKSWNDRIQVVRNK